MADGSVARIKQPTEIPNPACPHVAIAHNAVIRAMARDGIGKGGRNKEQGYSFRGIDQILDELPAALTQAGLNISPRMLSRDVTERKTKSGGALFVVVVSAEYEFQSAIDGSTKVVGPFYGEASDTADKATNKAMSAAYKYMATQTFCIPFKGMEDADAATHEVQPRDEQDDTDRELLSFKAEALARIAKCDTHEALDRLKRKIEEGVGYRTMTERRPRDANAIMMAVEKRHEELGPVQRRAPIIDDEVPF